MLQLFIPSNAAPERHYIADVVFKQFLGLDIEICKHQRREVVITDGTKRRLVLDDTFFEEWEGGLGPANQFPTLPLRQWEVTSSGLEVPLVRPLLPVIFGKPLSNGSFLQSHGKELRLGLDILGSIFFVLTRYEEVVNPTRDHYDRFPASASIAVKEGFLDRPIVNEYTEILWECILRLWGGLERRRSDFRVLLSHDVDQPFLLFRSSASKIARGMMGEFKRNRPMAALKKPSQWLRSHVFGPTCDPAYTFNYIMDLSERRNLRSAFYFIPSLSAGPPDYRYGILDPAIQKLLSDIDRRGHEIGYHASIETYKDNSLVQKEVALLRQACERAGSKQTISGSRQHYLRIEVPSTLAYLAEARLNYDATLSFADRAGFRCGTCWEYEFFDVLSRKRLGIIERPLVVMECSVIDNEYMGLGLGQAALDVIIKLAGVCRKFSGNFTLLWHNTRLVSSEERHFYERVLESLGTA